MNQPDYHRPEAPSDQNTKSCPQAVRELHELYCHWTAQTLSLRFDRERLWYEFLRAGFTAQDLKRVLSYLQKEIGSERRNIGALKYRRHRVATRLSALGSPDLWVFRDQRVRMLD